ncbi:MAG: hypothetical protein LBQ24_05005 [Candidatus Peribacteria bacterium]|jgi:hypothetical protein|nr:hypothetical protein [Candidatus Peribacteria bacterium]
MLVKERVLKSQKIKPKNKNNNVIVIFFITLLFALTLYISIFELKVIIFDLLLITIIIF